MQKSSSSMRICTAALALVGCASISGHLGGTSGGVTCETKPDGGEGWCKAGWQSRG